MKKYIEKQKLEWQQELNKQLEIKKNAEKVLEETTKTILRIDGGLVAMEKLLKNSELANQPSGTVELTQQSETVQPN